MPADPVAIAVALADKIDTLVGFWLIDEKPTGSKDPYALRRAALGVIRIVIENELRLPLAMLLWHHFGAVARDERLAEAIAVLRPLNEQIIKLSASDVELAMKLEVLVSEKSKDVSGPLLVQAHSYLRQTHELLAFFADRLKVRLREQGARHDLVDAVFALEGQDDLLMVVRRVEALGKFLDTDDGKNLLAGVKRASNIIRIEEKKDKREYTGAPDAKLYRAGGRKGAGRGHRRGQERSRRRGRQGGLRRRHDRHGQAAAARSTPSSTRSPSMSTTRRCAKTGSSCSTKSARPPARWRISPRSRDSCHSGRAGFRTARDSANGTLTRPITFQQRPSNGESTMHIGLAHLPAIVALIAGILILVVPRLLNYIVAIYLILVGLFGLGIIH